MTARSFTQEEFNAAIDGLLTRGIRPTVRKVRQRLGGGSNETLGPMLAAWRETQVVTASGHGAAPAVVQVKASELAAAVWSLARQQASEELDAVRERLEMEHGAVVEELSDARLDIAELEASLVDLRRLLAAETAAREDESRQRLQAAQQASRAVLLEEENRELLRQVEALRREATASATVAARHEAVAEALRTQLADLLNALGQQRSTAGNGAAPSSRSPKRASGRPVENGRAGDGA